MRQTLLFYDWQYGWWQIEMSDENCKLKENYNAYI